MQQYQRSLLDTIMDGDFFVAVGLGEISDNEKASILSTMAETVMARVFAQIFDDLAEHDQAVLKEISPEELAPFLAARNVDFFTLITEEAVKHRLEVVMVYRNATAPQNLEPETVSA